MLNAAADWLATLPTRGDYESSDEKLQRLLEAVESNYFRLGELRW